MAVTHHQPLSSPARSRAENASPHASPLASYFRPHPWPRRTCRTGSIVLAATEAPWQRNVKNAVKPVAAPRLSAPVSVYGKHPAFTVETALTRVSIVLRGPQGGSPPPGWCRAQNFPPFPKLALMNEQIPNPPSDPLALGKTLTFEQAEGIEPLRRPLMNAPTAYWMQARDNKAGGK
jgi:hypothetical protein